MAAEPPRAVQAVRDYLRDAMGMDAQVSLEAATRSERSFRRDQLKSGRAESPDDDEDLMSQAVMLALQIQSRNESAADDGADDDEDMPELDDGPSGNVKGPPAKQVIEYAFKTMRGFCDPAISDGAIRDLFRFNDFNQDVTVEALLAYGERGSGAAEQAVVELMRLEAQDKEIAAAATTSLVVTGSDDSSPAPPPAHEEPVAPPRVQTLAAVTEELFQLCDWENSEAGSDMVDLVQNRLFSPPLDELEPRKLALSTHRPYSGGSDGPVSGTLLHMLADFPPNHPGAGSYAGLVNLLVNVCEGVVEVDAGRSSDPETPLYRACVRGHSEVANLLAHRGANAGLGCGPGAQTPLLAAIAGAPEDPPQHKRCAAVAQMLIGIGGDALSTTMPHPSRLGEITPIWEAVRSMQKGCLNDLLNAGCDPNISAGGLPPILLAVTSNTNNLRCAELLFAHPSTDLSVRADVPGNASNTTALIEAARKYRMPWGAELFRKLLAGISSATLRARAEAAAEGSSDQETLEVVDVDAVNAKGESAASLCVSLLQPLPRIKTLVQLAELPNPADLSRVDLGNTLLEVIRMREQGLPWLKSLVTTGKVQVDVPGRRPLDSALRRQEPWSEEMLELLVEVGQADVNTPPDVDASNPSAAAGATGPALGVGAPPLVAATKLMLFEHDAQLKRQQAHEKALGVKGPGGKIMAGERGYVGSSREERALEELAQGNASLRLAARKLSILASAPTCDKTVKDVSPPFGTPLDLLLVRHEKLLKSLESTGAGSFWSEASAMGEAGWAAIPEQQAKLEAACSEVNEWGPVVEASPLPREHWTKRAEEVREQLGLAADRRNVWVKLNEALSAFEDGAPGSNSSNAAEAKAPPPLAGKDWFELRHELSYRNKDDDGSGEGVGDDEEENTGLTSLEDVRRPGDQVPLPGATVSPTVAPQLEADGSSDLMLEQTADVAAVDAVPAFDAGPEPVEPPPPTLLPSSDVTHFLAKHDLAGYGDYCEEEDIDLELLLSMDESDLDEFMRKDEDMPMFLEGIQAEPGLVTAHAAWKEAHNAWKVEHAAWEEARDEAAAAAAAAKAREADSKQEDRTAVNAAVEPEVNDAILEAADAAEAAADAAAAAEEEEEQQAKDGAGDDSDEEEDGPSEGDNFVLSAVPGNIELTRYAYRWIQKEDPVMVEMALKKIHLLAEGPVAWRRSRQLSKALEGQQFTPSRYPVREAKLDKGMRILWQERGAVDGNNNEMSRGAIIVWYIVKHDFISARLRDIDRCFARMNGDRLAAAPVAPTDQATDGAAAGAAAAEGEDGSSGASGGGGGGSSTSQRHEAFDAAFRGGAQGMAAAGRHVTVPEVLLDPRGNTPLMVYDIMVHELPELKTKWQPPMRLTNKEKSIVVTDGLVTIVGRSGTGKTVCVAMRMDLDAKRAMQGNAQQRSLRQVFVARSRALCAQVKRMVEGGGHQAASSASAAAAERDGGSGLAITAAAETHTSFGSTGGSSGGVGGKLEVSSEWERPPPQFVTIDDFVGLVEDCVLWPNDQQPHWDRASQVRWVEFERDFWPTLSKTAKKGFGCKAASLTDKAAAAGGGGGKKGKGKAAAAAADDSSTYGSSGDEALVPLTVWTQIRSLLKGSVEAAWGFSPPDPPKPYTGSDPKQLEAYRKKCDDVAEMQQWPVRRPGTPMNLAEYEKLPHGRCPLSLKQRRAAFEYYEMYAAWLETEDKWDDADRILHLVGRLKSIERGQASSSIFRGARVPFDRIYADEVQDATQAEVTLFLLACNDNVNGLFLAGDNAQAITHGVSFRFEELRMILKLADQRKDTIKPLSLTKNYRSHSGVLEFAATFLTQLDVCFPDSFQKLDADFGLSRGPRPGCWTAPKGMASLRAALKLDQRLIVLTRDEHAKQLEVLLGENDPELASTVNVLGICESKGLEFNDVILVDFFSTAPKHLQEAWNKLLNLKVLDPEGLSARAGHSSSESSSKGGWVTKSTAALQTAAKGAVPHDLVVDLKLLYTAVTRCRNRLVVAETIKPTTGPWAKFTKVYEKLGLVTPHSLAVEPSADGTNKAEIMMPDELVELGLDFIERVDPWGGDPEQAQRDCHNAVKFFKRAGEVAKEMVARVEVVAKHVAAWDAVKQTPKEDWTSRESLAADACTQLLSVGLASDAATFARLVNGSDCAVVAPLVKRLESLDRKWRRGHFSGETKVELE